MIASGRQGLFFTYSEKEILHLKQKDKTLGEAMDKIGPVRREVNPDLFSAVVNAIIGQQISIAAQHTVWRRLCALLGDVTPASVAQCGVDAMQALGMTYKKAEYILMFARSVDSGALDMQVLHDMSDEEVVRVLSTQKGIGVWTAEMLMLFSMQRRDILSYGDIAIHRGMRMLYHHRRIDRKLFEKYRRRYSPFGSVASLYLWEIACGAIPGMRDFAPKRKAK